MDKTLLKNFATYSRNKLIDDVKNQAQLLGITDKGIEAPLSKTSDMAGFDIGTSESYQIYGKQVKQYERLTEELKTREKNSDYATAYSSLVEEVAYTWFNRIIAIRFMEVNNYLPDRMRVISSGIKGVDEPEFITDYNHISLDLSDREKEEIIQLKLEGSARSMDQIFQSLFIKECNRLNDYLPELFEKIDDYMEILLTLSYIDEDGVVYKLIHDIPEEYFDVESENGYGQVELIGWLYQYYNSERKDEVFARPKSKKIQKDDIAPVTQLFTPDWIVKYMVENSLGRLWIEKLLAGGDKRSEKEIAEDFQWEYYIPEAEQEESVKEELDKLRESRKDLKLEEITFIDPAMGSFHIGVYAFDVFMQLYESQGYTPRDAVKSIIENNLFGIDIDKRAYQLSYFALMMKARQYSRRILTEDNKLNLHKIIESNSINKEHLKYLGYSMEQNIKDKILKEIKYLIDTFCDAREYGSILKVDKLDWEGLYEFVNAIDNKAQISIGSYGLEKTQADLKQLVKLGEALSNKYDVVVTNPPYMGSSAMNSKLKKYLAKEYPASKSDFFAVSIEKCKDLIKTDKYYGMITQHSWMFLSSYEKLREKLRNNSLQNMLHLGPRAFEEIGGEVVQTTSFIYKNKRINNFKGNYIRLIDFSNARKKEEKTLEAIGNPSCGYYYETNQDNFEKIPGMPVAYWASVDIFRIFIEGKKIEDIAFVATGISTGNNNKYLRSWFEINYKNIALYKRSMEQIDLFETSWIPYNKGGEARKWFGNNEYIVKWSESSNFHRSRPTFKDIYLKEGLTWSFVTSGIFTSRYYPDGFLWDVAGSPCIIEDKKLMYYVLGYLSTKIANNLLKIINSTINFQIVDIQRIPIIIYKNYFDYISICTKKNIYISKTDWDTFETSWDFKVFPLANFPTYMDNYYDSLVEIGIMAERESFYISNMETAYEHYKDFTNSQFDKLKANEEELNRIFIEIYGLEDELDPYVSDRDVTIAKIFDTKKEKDDNLNIGNNRYVLTKEDVIKQFISYGVGCIMGRYSLDNPGLAYAGGDWDDSKYKSFKPVEDNIVLITDKPYFDDDLLSRFINFVEVVYGKDSLEENLDFIASTLGGRGDSREIIRKYFLVKFFADHVKTYKKTPIYWLYDGGADKTKANNQDSFKALVYMHRYNEDTTGKVRIDYLHEVQRAYERRLENLNYEIANSDNSRQIAQAEKEVERISKQLKEVKDYDEKIGHLALARIGIDLDDGVKVNYEKVQTDEKGKKLEILAKI